MVFSARPLRETQTRTGSGVLWIDLCASLSAHKTLAVRDFLRQHSRVRFHFTPTYSSWLNQVEIWFAKIEREVIARHLLLGLRARKLRRSINAYSAHDRPVQWKYSDPARRVRSDELTATCH